MRKFTSECIKGDYLLAGLQSHAGQENAACVQAHSAQCTRKFLCRVYPRDAETFQIHPATDAVRPSFDTHSLRPHQIAALTVVASLQKHHTR